MTCQPDGSPPVGSTVNMIRSRPPGAGSFESAVVVEHLTDPALGLVLEVQFADSVRMQRVWPSPTIRLA
jgi:hypothetical protein